MKPKQPHSPEGRPQRPQRHVTEVSETIDGETWHIVQTRVRYPATGRSVYQDHGALSGHAGWRRSERWEDVPLGDPQGVEPTGCEACDSDHASVALLYQDSEREW